MKLLGLEYKVHLVRTKLDNDSTIKHVQVLDLESAFYVL